MSQPLNQAVTSYLDSSARVKRYLVEIGTPWVQAWCDDPAQTVAVAEIGLGRDRRGLCRQDAGRTHHAGSIPQRSLRSDGRCAPEIHLGHG